MKGTIEDFKKRIMAGEITFKQAHDESAVYLGNRTYSHLDHFITPEGRAAGWMYKYPCLNFDGVMYLDAGKTIEGGIADGHLQLTTRTTSHCG